MDIKRSEGKDDWVKRDVTHVNHNRIPENFSLNAQCQNINNMIKEFKTIDFDAIIQNKQATEVNNNSPSTLAVKQESIEEMTSKNNDNNTLIYVHNFQANKAWQNNNCQDISERIFITREANECRKYESNSNDQSLRWNEKQKITDCTEENEVFHDQGDDGPDEIDLIYSEIFEDLHAMKIKSLEPAKKNKNQNDIESNEQVLQKFETQFEVIERLGQGLFGEVYKVKNKIDGEYYAMKQVKIEKFNLDYCKKEVDILIKFTGECIVEYKDSWIENDIYYIQMEFCSDNLKNIIEHKSKAFERPKHRPMNAIECFVSTEILREVLECVQYLHESSPPVIHRDLKPANILVSYQNRNGKYLKLCDFGLAKDQIEGETSLTELAKSDYRATEVTYSKHYTIKSDVYSVGIIAKELYDFESYSEPITVKYEGTRLIHNFIKIEDLINQMIISGGYDLWNRRPTADTALTLANKLRFETNDMKNSSEFATIATKLYKYENKFFYIHLTDKINSSKCSPTKKHRQMFQMISLIGSGTFGKVFKVMDKNYEYFALKKIKIKEKDEKYGYKEIETMAKINGDLVVNYKTSWVEENIIYIQMELCDDNLKNIINMKRSLFGINSKAPMYSINYFISTEIFREVLECVKYLHESNPPIIHRDLKPANILVSYSNKSGRTRIKICDFGLATFHTNLSMSHTKGVGTYAYSAPEVANGRHYNMKADIYSLAQLAQDLIEIDINDTNTRMKFKKLFGKQYIALEDIIQSMLEGSDWKKRPPCAEILAHIDDCLMSVAQLKSSANFNSNLNQLETYENVFFYKYINERLMH